MVETFIPYFLRSSIIAWVNPTNPNLLALYAAPFSKKFAPARLAIVIIYPFDLFSSRENPNIIWISTNEYAVDLLSNFLETGNYINKPNYYGKCLNCKYNNFNVYSI